MSGAQCKKIYKLRDLRNASARRFLPSKSQMRKSTVTSRTEASSKSIGDLYHILLKKSITRALYRRFLNKYLLHCARRSGDTFV